MALAPRLACLLLLIGLALPAAAKEEAKGPLPLVVVQTRHLVLRARLPAAQVDAYGVLGEQTIAGVLAHFDRKELPGGTRPFRIEVHPDRAHFVAAVGALHPGVSLKGLGGYTSFAQRRAHLFVQRSDFDTRRVFIHELVHLVHDALLKVGTRERTPVWYREGLAEHFGWHRRMADGVTFGALDVLALHHRPLLAKHRVMKTLWAYWECLMGKVPTDYTDAVALFEGLRRTQHEGLREAFRAWERDHLRRGAGRAELRTALMPHRSVLLAEMRAVWGAYAPTWRALDRGFDERARRIRMEPGPEGRPQVGRLVRTAPLGAAPLRLVLPARRDLVLSLRTAEAKDTESPLYTLGLRAGTLEIGGTLASATRRLQAPWPRAASVQFELALDQDRLVLRWSTAEAKGAMSLTEEAEDPTRRLGSSIVELRLADGQVVERAP